MVPWKCGRSHFEVLAHFCPIEDDDRFLHHVQVGSPEANGLTPDLPSNRPHRRGPQLSDLPKLPS
eukprot:3473619-Heterocapsa_arctica.AAC.1